MGFKIAFRHLLVYRHLLNGHHSVSQFNYNTKTSICNNQFYAQNVRHIKKKAHSLLHCIDVHARAERKAVAPCKELPRASFFSFTSCANCTAITLNHFRTCNCATLLAGSSYPSRQLTRPNRLSNSGELQRIVTNYDKRKKEHNWCWLFLLILLSIYKKYVCPYDLSIYILNYFLILYNSLMYDR